MKKIALLALLAIGVSCERDDICEEGRAVTPQLILSFYDEAVPTEKKDVENLLVFGLNDANEIVQFASSSVTTTDSIAFPLRTDADVTRIVLQSDSEVNDNGTPDDTSDDFLEGNQDIIDFGYTRSEVYVSRACGFVFNYLELTATQETTTDTDPWILQITIDNPTVQNETQAHVKIFH